MAVTKKFGETAVKTPRHCVLNSVLMSFSQVESVLTMEYLDSLFSADLELTDLLSLENEEHEVA